MRELEPHTAGYMKPPAGKQFKPGKSGNPNGRPKQPPTPYIALQNALKRKVALKGDEKKIRLDEALIRRLRELALSGDRRAINLQQKIVEISGISTPTHSHGEDLLAAKERFAEMDKKYRERANQKENRDDE